MMMNKRLINTVSQSKKYIAGNVAFQWCSMAANIAGVFAAGNLIGRLAAGKPEKEVLWGTVLVVIAVLAVRCICLLGSARMSFLSSESVKKTLRREIYQKLLRLGSSYQERVSTSEVVQMSVEGVDQLETYFGAYLPQFFYSMLAPVTLFAVLSFISVPPALVLLLCVPLIPAAIAAVQIFAKKLLGKYWGQYTALGDIFLENLQGLTTLKIYQADEYKSRQMDEEAEKFRKITMKVLTMQLNSISVMDLVAFGGAALGVILSLWQLLAGNISLAGCFVIILLAAEFFIPMRQLGSFFHIAMNGMAASDKIFNLLDLPEPQQGKAKISVKNPDISIKHVSFSYDREREVLKDIIMEIPGGSFTAVAGESGCGKSTLAALLMGRNKSYSGSIQVGGIELSQASEESLMKSVTYVGHDSYIFKGSVRDNLKMGDPGAEEEKMWNALEKVNLADFLRTEEGLDTQLEERASNLSGGQRQRLALARALLHDSPVYIFDEATSNIDVESENEIMAQIRSLKGNKSVILISHRLANLTGADRVYMMENGRVCEAGTHEELLDYGGGYARLWKKQQELEMIGKGGGQE
ncbi:ABC-type transport system involved in cytochrome bd biosynthesis fused ATPase/permease subunit [Cuneatibacter caecimuris]|uniref:ABC-type transport system involved in cytochrome bd biosynthesis fused ATPase/permease subunit n=2 Tax=Cuneatibacter caecimuris TaxID=1796618 RepID=A0A4V2F7R4_9FIRM|nr:ABC transporter ATP-binding protein/permease [Cuneatibacter caecimuris]RZT00730.1 ABC-type transport system involved in cytochrome bd biosynthesis fused ATPase/permease subunit [Cuneatibacter caecimuris]